MSNYVDWLTRTMLGDRQAADLGAAKRAVVFVANSLSQTITTPQLRHALQSRLASLPYIEKMINEDPTLATTLSLRMQPNRVIARDRYVEAGAFVAAVVDTFSQGYAEVTDLAGKRFYMSLISILGASPYSSVAHHYADQTFIDQDPRLELLSAPVDTLRDRLLRQQRSWDLEAADLDALAERLETLGPRERLDTLDAVMERNLMAFYWRLRTDFSETGVLSPFQLIPRRLEGLLHFAASSAQDAENRAEILLRRAGLEEALLRVMSLPQSLPQCLITRVDSLSSPDKKRLVRTLGRRVQSTVPAFHLLRLALRVLDKHRSKELFATAYLSKLIKRGEDVASFISFVEWTLTEIRRHEDSETITAEQSLLAAWIHASHLAEILQAHGIAMPEIAAAANESHQWERLLEDNPLRTSAANPQNVFAGPLILACLHDSLTDEPDLCPAFSQAIEYICKSEQLPFPSEFSLNVAQEPDAFPSLLACDIRDVLRDLLGEVVHDRLEHLGEAEVLRQLKDADNNDRKHLWGLAAAWTQTHLTITDEFRDLLRSELSRGVDIVFWRAQPVAWRARTAALANALSQSDAASLGAFLRASIEVSASEKTGDRRDAATLLESFTRLSQPDATRRKRIEDIVEALGLLVNGNGEFAKYAGERAMLIRDRAKADMLNEKVSRVILTARIRG